MNAYFYGYFLARSTTAKIFLSHKELNSSEKIPSCVFSCICAEMIRFWIKGVAGVLEKLVSFHYYYYSSFRIAQSLACIDQSPYNSRISCADRNGAETMEQKMCPQRQSSPIFDNVKTPESVTKKVITLVMLV